MNGLWLAWRHWIESQIEDPEQVRIQFAIARTAPLMGVMAALIETVFYWNRVPKLPALIWFAAIAANHGWYLWLRGRFHRAKPGDKQLPDWAAKHVAGLAVCGATWGMSAWVFGGSTGPSAWNIMLMTMGGTAIIGLLTFTSLFPAHSLFTIGMMLPVVFLSLLRGGELNYVGAALACMLLGILLVQGRRQATSVAQVLLTQRENVRLLEQLKQEDTAKEQALRDAREAIAAKSRFFSAVSHDVRQPLYSLSLLLDTVCKADTLAEQADTLDHMRQSVNMLDNLFTQFLEMSRLEAGAVMLRPEPIALAPLLHQLAQTFGPRAHGKALALHVQATTVWARADRALLQRVLVNLLSNAVNYTIHGSVTLACHVNGEHIVVSVQDTGPGIAQDQQEQVFEEFYRVAHNGAVVAGFGLGLPIVRRLLRSMGSEVYLHSSPGQGSHFSFALPATAPYQPELPGPQTDDLLAGARIGLIEDDKVAAGALAQLLTSWGTKVQVACSAKDALAWQMPMDALITDFQLGGDDAMTGVDVADALNVRWRAVTARATPVLVVSSLPLTPELARGFTVLIKPAPSRNLRAWLLQAITAARDAAQA
jgi:two-component system, sensor histidine kinase